jgi:hypothetical protein
MSQNGSERSRSSAIKQVGNQIMLSPSNGGIPSSSKDGDYWTKIIMHNVEQFQKDKDAVKLKVKEDQTRIREELLRQMEQHKQAKVEAKRGDLEYFDYIVTKKEEQERDQREKKVNVKRMMEEEKVVRDKQIEEHARAKYLVDKEKRRELDRLRGIEQELQDEKANKKAAEREKKERTLASYKEQI